MKTNFQTSCVILAGLFALPCFADNIASTIDGGGQRTSSANYVKDGSVGGVAGIAWRPEQPTRTGHLTRLSRLANGMIRGFELG